MRKRTPVTVVLDAMADQGRTVLTDRAGEARLDLPPGSGKVLVGGNERFHGGLDG